MERRQVDAHGCGEGSEIAEEVAVTTVTVEAPPYIRWNGTITGTQEENPVKELRTNRLF